MADEGSSQALARVTGDLDAPRGPDVTYSVEVPGSWLAAGATITVELPRVLACAACAGGGCDACERAGALRLRSAAESPESVQVTLPSREYAPGASLCVRVPGQGAGSRVQGLGRGHLLLTVAGADAPGPGVALVESQASAGPDARVLEERRRLMFQSGALALGLIALFFGLLRLSGWL